MPFRVRNLVETPDTHGKKVTICYRFHSISRALCIGTGTGAAEGDELVRAGAQGVVLRVVGRVPEGQCGAGGTAGLHVAQVHHAVGGQGAAGDDGSAVVQIAGEDGLSTGETSLQG